MGLQIRERRSLALVLALVVAVAAAPLAVVASTRPTTSPPPLAAFAALPAVTDVAVSMDGRRLAWAVPDDAGGQDLVLFEMATRTHSRIDMNDTRLVGLRFEDSGALLITASTVLSWSLAGTKDDLSRTFAYHPDTREIVNLLGSGGRIRNQITASFRLVSLMPDQSDRVAMMGFDARRGGVDTIVPHLYVVDLRTGRAVSETAGREHTLDWVVDASGEPIARLDFDATARTTELLVKEPGTGAWRTAIEATDTATPPFRPVGHTSAGSVILGTTDTEFGAFRIVNRRTLAVSDFVRAEDVEIGGLRMDRWTGAIIGIDTEGLFPATQWIDAEFQAIQADLDGRFGGMRVEIASTSRDRRTVAFKVANAATPATWFVLDRTQDRLLRIGATYPSLQEHAGGTVLSETFTARDGAEIPVYITLPAGQTEASRAPMVVLPHGGPAARDYPAFDWMAQFLAARGYLVLQPQFRGSTGFGASFSNAGYREWGGLMQDDVTDAVRWVIGRGWADPARVCIVGASYGGYAALAGASLTPDLYACAVSFGGVSDLRRMLRFERTSAGGDDSIATNYWAEHIGDLSDASLDAVSPVKLAERVRAPVLLIHGLDDTVVPPDQSRAMAAALRRANRTVELVELRDTDHWLTTAPSRYQLLQRVEAFLARHIGTPPPAGSAAGTADGAGRH